MNDVVDHEHTEAELVIPACHCGSDGSAQGGYACARIVALVGGRPGGDPAGPRAGVPGRRVPVWTVARHRTGGPRHPGQGRNVAAAAGYRGHTSHPFPTAVRSDRPGPRTGCAWPSHAAAVVPVDQVWGTPDCTGGWGTDLRAHPMVLSRVTVELTGPVPPLPGVRGVSRARHTTHGRTVVNLTALYDADGRPVARAIALRTVVRSPDVPAARTMWLLTILGPT